MQTLAPERTSRRERLGFAIGTAAVVLIALLLSLAPKPENDLFFELRIGGDILASHHLPHFDTYSWSRYGTRWVVPEWLAFVLYALAYKAGGLFGSWTLLAALTVGAALALWIPLARRIGAGWAFGPVALALIAMSSCFQERPYAFTYLLLPIGLGIIGRARAGNPRALLWLIPLCILWTNLHQGVVVLICVLGAYVVGDGLNAAIIRLNHRREGPPDLLAAGWENVLAARAAEARAPLTNAKWMLAAAIACAVSAMASPYGWRVFQNIYITVGNRQLMANVTEWNPITALPATQLEPFALLALLTIAVFASAKRRNLGDALALLGLFIESTLHARNIALFAVGSIAIAAPYYEEVAARLRRIWVPSRPARALLRFFAFAVVLGIAASSLAGLRRAYGPGPLTVAGFGDAVAQLRDYPICACEFIQDARWPPHFHLLNDFEIGGYLMHNLPSRRVFIDGRLDVYAGKVFNDNLILARDFGSPRWRKLVKEYGFDCVLTANSREAAAFAALRGWRVAYVDPKKTEGKRYWVAVRERSDSG